MAVTVDATATAVVVVNNGTTVTISTLTVTAAATALLVWISFSASITNVLVKWDNAGTPQTMTQLATITSSGGATARLYGLLAPTIGNKSLVATWTTSSDAVIDAIAFAGTATDTIANCFKGAATNSGSGTSGTVTVSGGAVGNISVAGVATDGSSLTSLAATGSTSVFNDSSLLASGGSRAPSAASVAWTATLGTGAWAIVGVDVSVGGSPAAVAWHRPIVSRPR